MTTCLSVFSACSRPWFCSSSLSRATLCCFLCCSSSRSATCSAFTLPPSLEAEETHRVSGAPVCRGWGTCSAGLGWAGLDSALLGWAGLVLLLQNLALVLALVQTALPLVQFRQQGRGLSLQGLAVFGQLEAEEQQRRSSTE